MESIVRLEIINLDKLKINERIKKAGGEYMASKKDKKTLLKELGKAAKKSKAVTKVKVK